MHSKVKVCLVLGTAVMGLVFSLPLAAASLNLTASVPFEFNADRAIMPAGEYHFEVDSGTSILLVRSFDAHAAAYSLVVPAPKGHASSGKISFNRYGNKYFLSSVVNEETGATIALPMSKSERELAKIASAERYEIPVVLARR